MTNLSPKLWEEEVRSLCSKGKLDSLVADILAWGLPLVEEFSAPETRLDLVDEVKWVGFEWDDDAEELDTTSLVLSWDSPVGFFEIAFEPHIVGWGSVRQWGSEFGEDLDRATVCAKHILSFPRSDQSVIRYLRGVYLSEEPFTDFITHLRYLRDNGDVPDHQRWSMSFMVDMLLYIKVENINSEMMGLLYRWYTKALMGSNTEYIAPMKSGAVLCGWVFTSRKDPLTEEELNI